MATEDTEGAEETRFLRETRFLNVATNGVATMPDIVLALVPHPDDAEFYCGGTLAKLVAEGATLYIVVATDGRKGSFLEESNTLAELRAEEMRRAAAVLGAQPPVLLGFPDMELDTLRPGVLREQFVRAIRRYRPDAVFAEDPYGIFEPHPDHRAVAWAATEAINAARLPLAYPQHLAEGLQPHFVREKYFYGNALPFANKVVDTTAYIERKLAALSEHRSQVVFFVEEILREAEMVGVDPAAFVGPGSTNPNDLLRYGISAQDADIGRKAGVAFAEEFRWQRYHPLVEAALAAGAPAEPGRTE
jgi:LmbE family N-acetylglucosaminyl deacetylase